MLKEVQMEDHWQRSIKEIIEEFPQVEKILTEFGMECGVCRLGLCRFKDIVAIHRLPAAEEKSLLACLSQVMVSGGGDILQAPPKSPIWRRENNLSPPIKKLMAEHGWIKRWIALIPRIRKSLALNTTAGKIVVLEGLDFIRNYADKFHHAKEEDILFKFFAENLDILQVMFAEHEQARGHRRAIWEALQKSDQEGVLRNLHAYQELLSQHIKKEDEILLPWLERQLSPSQLENLFSKFQEAERSIGFDPKKYEEFVKNLEEKWGG